jgi:DNA-binding MarR family transcriptional regulator
MGEVEHGGFGVPGGPMESVGFLLSQLGSVVARRFRQTLIPVGLEPRQFLVLRHVGVREGWSQQALAETLNIPPSRMVAIVDELERRGILERRLHPTDRRARTLHVTAEGRRIFGEAVRLAIGFERSICEGLAPEERDQLLALLGRLAALHSLSPDVHPELTLDETEDTGPVPPRGRHRTSPVG